MQAHNEAALSWRLGQCSDGGKLQTREPRREYLAIAQPRRGCGRRPWAAGRQRWPEEKLWILRTKQVAKCGTC